MYYTVVLERLLMHMKVHYLLYLGGFQLNVLFAPVEPWSASTLELKLEQQAAPTFPSADLCEMGALARKFVH
jgi:hypothetical protein